MNADKVDPSVLVQIKPDADGFIDPAAIVLNLDKGRIFSLNINGFMMVEDELSKERGEPVNILKEINWSNFGIRDVRFIMYVGLKDDDPSLTLEQCGRICSVFGLIRSKEMIMRSLQSSFPEMEETLKKFMTKATKTEETSKN